MPLRSWVVWIAGLVPWRIALFAAATAAYVLWALDPRLIYSLQSNMGELFQPGLRSLPGAEFVPGRALDLLSMRLTELHFYGWPGAAMIGVLTGLTLWAIVLWAQRTCGRTRGAWIVPGILLVVLHSRYDYNIIEQFRLLLALGLALAWTYLPWRSSFLRLALGAIASVGLYQFALGAWLPFVLCIVIFEGRKHPVRAARTRAISIFGWAGLAIAASLYGAEALHWVPPHSWWIAVLCVAIYEGFRHGKGLAVSIALLSTAAVLGFDAWTVPWSIYPWRSRLLPVVPDWIWAPTAWRSILPNLNLLLSWALFLWPVVWVLLVLLPGWILDRAWPDLAAQLRAMPSAKSSSRSGPARTAMAVLALCAAAAAAGHYSVDPVTVQTLRIDYLAESKQWGRVLDEALKMPPRRYPQVTGLEVTLALYHTSRMGEDMFRYPQEWPLVSPIDSQATPQVLARLSDLYMELGRLNESEACAGLVQHPSMLRRLAFLHILKGQPETARVCLRRCANDWIEGPWARQCLERLDTDPALGGDAEVRRLRPIVVPPEQDGQTILYVRKSADAEREFLKILDHDPTNRMAFELLMAQYLILGRLDDFAANLHYLEHMPYRTIPRHYEEAMLVGGLKGGQEPKAPAGSIRPETRARWEAFLAAMRQRGLGIQQLKTAMQEGQQVESLLAAKNELAPAYGDTFYYHYCFDQ